MGTSSGLARFLKGPLADRKGGSSAARAAAERHEADSDEPDLDHEADQEPGDYLAPTRSTFRLLPGRALFDYQTDVVSQMEEVFQGDLKPAKALVSLPTGAGKTRTAVGLFQQLCESGCSRRLLWIAPSVELIDQAVGALREAWLHSESAPCLNVHVGVWPTASARDGKVVAAVLLSAQKVARDLSAIRRFSPDLVVFDEAHQAVARTYRAIIDSVAACGECTTFGLTATPGRAESGESSDLSAIFGGRLLTSVLLGDDPVGSLVSRGVLSTDLVQLAPIQ